MHIILAMNKTCVVVWLHACWICSPSTYILKYSSTLLKFIVQKVLTVLLPFHNLDLKFVNVWPQKKIFFTVTFSTFNFFFFQTTFQCFYCLSVESIFLRRFFGKLWRAFLGLWFDLFWFWNKNKLLYGDWSKFSIW